MSRSNDPIFMFDPFQHDTLCFVASPLKQLSFESVVLMYSPCMGIYVEREGGSPVVTPWPRWSPSWWSPRCRASRWSPCCTPLWPGTSPPSIGTFCRSAQFHSSLIQVLYKIISVTHSFLSDRAPVSHFHII